MTDTVCPINYEIIDVRRDGILEPSAATKLNDQSQIVKIMNTLTIGITESVITFKVKASTFNSQEVVHPDNFQITITCKGSSELIFSFTEFNMQVYKDSISDYSFPDVSCQYSFCCREITFEVRNTGFLSSPMALN